MRLCLCVCLCAFVHVFMCFCVFLGVCMCTRVFVCVCARAHVVHADLKVEEGLKLNLMMGNHCHLFNIDIPVISVAARDTEGCARVRVCVCV